MMSIWSSLRVCWASYYFQKKSFQPHQPSKNEENSKLNEWGGREWDKEDGGVKKHTKFNPKDFKNT